MNTHKEILTALHNFYTKREVVHLVMKEKKVGEKMALSFLSEAGIEFPEVLNEPQQGISMKRREELQAISVLY